MGSEGVSDSGSNGKLPAMGYTMARSSFCSCSLCGAEKAGKGSDVVLHSTLKEGRIVVEVIFSPTLLAATVPVESPLPAEPRSCWKLPVLLRALVVGERRCSACPTAETFCQGESDLISDLLEKATATGRHWTYV
jgi:hypothetical protein